MFELCELRFHGAQLLGYALPMVIQIQHGAFAQRDGLARVSPFHANTETLALAMG